MSKAALETYKESMHLATQELNPLVASQLRRSAKRKLQIEKTNSWRSFLNKTALERTQFKIAQSIYNKDFIKIKSKKYHFPEAKAKVPNITESVERTEEIWKQY